MANAEDFSRVEHKQKVRTVEFTVQLQVDSLNRVEAEETAITAINWFFGKAKNIANYVETHDEKLSKHKVRIKYGSFKVIE